MVTPAMVCGVDKNRSKRACRNQTPRAMAPTTAVAKAAVPRNVVGLLINLIPIIENPLYLGLKKFLKQSFNSLTVNELRCFEIKILN
jgi:hypothetical protein